MPLSDEVRRVGIVEVGPRDGLQAEPELLSTALKVELITRLVEAGARRIEATSFVHPKRVPQMADAEQVMAAVPRLPGVSYIGLVLNPRGLERAIAARCDEVGMAVMASDTFNLRNQGGPTEQSVADWLAMAPVAHAAGIPPHVTISVAFGCPFEGEVDPVRVVAIARRLAEGRPTEIVLADTIGVAVPAQVADLVARVRAAVPTVPLRCHFHDTRNTAVANVQAALQAGVRVFDSSVGGAGGCPFAPAATGNVATEDLLYLFHRSGIDTGLSLEQTIEVGRWLRSHLKRGNGSALLHAGPFP